MTQENIKATTTVVTKKLNNWLDIFIDNIPNLIVAFIVLVFSFILSKYISSFVSKLVQRKVAKRSVANVISKIVSITILLIGLFLSLGVLNLDEALKSLLTGAGIAGIVIGMALQGTLSNTFAGIVLSFRNNIRIGHWIETNGFAGEVIEINLKEFTIKEADNNLVVIPNKMILENPLKNYSLTTKMRVSLQCGVGYNSDLYLVQKVTKTTIANAFSQIKSNDEVEFYYQEYGDSSINFLCRFWVDSESALEKLKAKSKAIIQLKKAFDDNNINIPFPIRTLQFDGNLETSIHNHK
ncbi:MAG: mechanosensitive ion channel [Tenacibaculum sp.]|nr:mechanosensitive ion channel [Tenacibaculum sp.]